MKSPKAIEVLLGRYNAQCYALMRGFVGALFAFHGLQNVFGVLSKRPAAELMSQMWIGGVIELVGGILVAIGLYTRSAAFIASGTMAVAYIQFHWKFRFDENFLPISNGGDSAVIYAFVFLYIASRGHGIWSVGKGI